MNSHTPHDTVQEYAQTFPDAGPIPWRDVPVEIIEQRLKQAIAEGKPVSSEDWEKLSTIPPDAES